MSMISKINHDVRIELNLSVIDYCVADIIQQTGKDTPTVESVRRLIGMSELDLWPILEVLKKQSLITISPKAANLKVTEKWREAVKAKPKERKGDPLSHFLREQVEVRKDNYFWDGWKDYQHADGILAQIRFKIKAKKLQRRDVSEVSDEEVKYSLMIILDSLPNNKFWKNIWDVAKLNANLNSIVDSIKEQSEGRIIESAKAIQEATNDFVPRTNWD